MDGWMDGSGDKWVDSSFPSSLPPFTFFSADNTHSDSQNMPDHTHTHQCDPHTSTRSTHAHTHSLIKLFPTLWPPAGVMNFRRFPKCLPTFLFELYTHLASSCCTHSHSYKHSITNTHTHTHDFPHSIHLNNHPQPTE